MQSVQLEIQNQKLLFAINHVHAIAKITEPLTIVPHTSERILGVINFRGKVLPIYDLNLAHNYGGYLVVLEKEGQLVGVLSEKLPLVCETEKQELYSLAQIFKGG